MKLVHTTGDIHTTTHHIHTESHTSVEEKN